MHNTQTATSALSGMLARAARSTPKIGPALVAIATAAAMMLPGSLQAAGGAAKTPDGCWASLYKGPHFTGEALALRGRTDIANIHTDWGFAWDPQFESISVGPRAVLTIYDNVSFRDRTARFGPGKHVPDLDEKMGIFRSIRSLRVRCSK